MTTIRVYELTEQWGIEFDYNNSVTAQRVFLETDATLPGQSKIDLPNIGDPFDEDYQDVTLKNIKVELINGSRDCGRKYFCSYDANPYLQHTGTMTLAELPISAEVSGEAQSVIPADGIWQWSDNTPITGIPFFYINAHTVMSVYRVIDDYDTYIKLCESIVNQVNLNPFRGYATETVMFNGAQCTPFMNKNGEQRWRVNLQFTSRIVTKNTTPGQDGWNFIINSDTSDWNKPHITGNPNVFIHDIADFDLLFSSDAIVDEPIIIPDK